MDWTIIAYGAACFAFGVFAGVVASILLSARERRLSDAEREQALAWVRGYVEKQKLREVVSYGNDRSALAMIAVVEPEGT